MKFDRKSFNEKAFGKYMETVPKARLNALIKANIFRSNENIKNTFSSQGGSYFATIPMFGRLSGTPGKYDGVTPFGDAKSIGTFEQGVIVIGRKDKFSENDFSYDITSKVDFMSQVGNQLGEYWDTANEDILISIIKGLFASNVTFANAHTTNANEVTTTTLNNAIQKACGDRKQKFALAIMNSAIATALENAKLLTYLTYNDPSGLEVQLNLAQWNGKLVLVDDSITTETVDGANKYVTYVLGNGSFDYENIGAKVPYEMDRDPDNDRDLLYSRERIVISPYGFSYTKANQETLTPSNAELADGSNWELVNDGAGNTINHKEIAIARIVTPVGE